MSVDTVDDGQLVANPGVQARTAAVRGLARRSPRLSATVALSLPLSASLSPSLSSLSLFSLVFVVLHLCCADSLKSRVSCGSCVSLVF